MRKAEQADAATLSLLPTLCEHLALVAPPAAALPLAAAWLGACALARRAPDDERMSLLFERLPAASPMPADLAVSALEAAGESSRCAVAAHHPALCLSDRSVAVRAAAMAALAATPALVEPHAVGRSRCSRGRSLPCCHCCLSRPLLSLCESATRRVVRRAAAVRCGAALRCAGT